MTASAKAVRFDDDSIWVHLDDARVIAAPLAWFPRWLAATPDRRLQFEPSPRGTHWEALDEDISIDGLQAGHGDLTQGRLVAPAREPSPWREPAARRVAATVRSDREQAGRPWPAV
jgi:hypothetical protein